jgi:CDP-glycerol glycerophosphotransferase (TagB/SpsB family)
MSALETFARAFAYVLARVLPKSNTAVLRAFPSYEDNVLAIYSALETRPIDRIVWVVDNRLAVPPVTLRKNTRLVNKGGVLDIYYSMTSRYLFLTHGHFLRSTPPNQVSVNLWHGIPFKAIGRTMGMEGRSDTFLVATSKCTQEVFVKAFGMPKDRVIITGQARTDRMLNVDAQAIWDLAFPGTPRPRQLFLWLPTFRSGPTLSGQADGSILGNVFNCVDFSEAAFNALLKANDAVCIVKPHPLASYESLDSFSNLLFINEDWLLDRRITLYQLTGSADCLISDISSIIADFMLLDRPIVLLFEDADEYNRSRGFSFEPISDFLPAEMSRDFNGFMTEIGEVLAGKDPYNARRNNLKSLFFEYTDSGAADRILKHVVRDVL